MGASNDMTNASRGDSTESVDGVFSTLTSEDRRLIIEMLVRSSEDGQPGMSISEVATELGSTRFSASRHLRILLESGLVTATRQGTAIIYAIRVEPLWSVEDWLLSLTSSG